MGVRCDYNLRRAIAIEAGIKPEGRSISLNRKSFNHRTAYQINSASSNPIILAATEKREESYGIKLGSMRTRRERRSFSKISFPVQTDCF